MNRKLADLLAHLLQGTAYLTVSRQEPFHRWGTSPMSLSVKLLDSGHTPSPDQITHVVDQ